jgi:hypothetical protein
MPWHAEQPCLCCTFCAGETFIQIMVTYVIWDGALFCLQCNRTIDALCSWLLTLCTNTQVFHTSERLKMHTPGLTASFCLSDKPIDKPFTTRTAQHWNHANQYNYYGHLQHWSHPARNFAFPDVAAMWAQDEGFEEVRHPCTLHVCVPVCGSDLVCFVLTHFFARL